MTVDQVGESLARHTEAGRGFRDREAERLKARFADNFTGVSGIVHRHRVSRGQW